MDAINKGTKAFHRTLKDNERDAILQYAMGEPHAQSGVKIQSLLKELYEHKRWVRCDCHSQAPEEKQSIEHLKENDGGLLYFVRNSSSARHSEFCGFYSDSRSAPAKTVKRKVLKSCVLNFHSEIQSEEVVIPASKATGSKTKNTETSERRSSLGSLMLNLMNDAKLNQLEKHDQKVYLNNLTQATTRFFVTEGISLNEVFAPSMAYPEWLDKKLADMAQDWPKKSRPYGMMADIVETLNEVTYLGNHTPLAPRATVGPYLVLGTYTNKTSEPKSLNFHFMRIVTIPIVEKKWPMPVESDLERQVAIKLKEVMKTIEQRYKINLSLEKPLLDTDVGQSSIRCDFVLKDNKAQKTLAIEVMGMNIDDYRDRKDRQIPIMQSVYDAVIEVDMSGNEQQEKKLTHMSIAIQKFFCSTS